MGKIIIKTQEEIEVIRQNGLILANAIALVAENLKPGVTGLYLDKLAEIMAQLLHLKVTTSFLPHFVSVSMKM
jgi:methionine aminopeptidase